MATEIKRRAAGGGVTFHTPMFGRAANPGQDDIVDEILGTCPLARCDYLYDFGGAVQDVAVRVPAGQAATTGTLTAFVVAPRAGRLIAATLVAEDALAANDTNYLTFSVTNRLGSGSGSTAMLAATDANTTKATGGSAITAKAARDLTVHGTAANLRVAQGDVLEFNAAATGTLANAVDDVTVLLRFATIPLALTPRITRTAGSPLVGPVDDVANGEVICQLSATNEANVAGFDFGDQVLIPANKAFLFVARVKISGAAAATRFLFGLGSAYTATLDNTADNAWFRVEGNDLSILAEADDGTTDTDDQDTGELFVADTYVTLAIDGYQTDKIRFWVNGQVRKTISAAAFAASDLLQPVLLVQKDSGTGENSFTTQFVRVAWNRL